MNFVISGFDELLDLLTDYKSSKVAAILEQPREYLALDRGKITQQKFEYFPENHYMRQIRKHQRQLNDPRVDHFVDKIVNARISGASMKGIWRDRIPETLDDLLESNREQELYIEIYPEPQPQGYDYIIEWDYLKWNPENQEWRK